MNPFNNLISIGCTIAIGSLLLTVGLQRHTISNLEDYKAQTEVQVKIAEEHNLEIEQKLKQDLQNVTISYETKISTLTTAHASELRLAAASRRPVPHLSTNTGGIDAIINYTACAEWSNGLIDQVQGFTSIADKLHDDCTELVFQARKQQAQLEGLMQICH